MVIPLKLLVHSQFSKSQGGLETWGVLPCMGYNDMYRYVWPQRVLFFSAVLVTNKVSILAILIIINRA